MVEFEKQTNLRIRLVYYPPYHGKYNPIERCWAALENYWKGTILNTIDDAIKWASNMTWNGKNIIIYYVEETYEKGVVVSVKELKNGFPFCKRSKNLTKLDVTIEPLPT